MAGALPRVLGATIFLGAFLLFQVQPLLGKRILPWFGGSPAVWTACMLFFQLALLAGYAYAHGLARRLGGRGQARLELAVLLAALLLLVAQALVWGAPLIPGPGFKPVSPDGAVLHIALLLTAAVGVPFLLLASTSPLLQVWFGWLAPGRSPFRLYGLSNAGSLLGLVTYPFLVEPNLSLSGQAHLWTGLFVVFAAGLAVVALGVMRRAPVPEAAEDIGPLPPAPRPRRHLFWLLATATGSTLLLSVTHHISTEVAVVPFLWVLPLALYLASFIFTFESDRWYRRAVFAPAMALLWLLIVVDLHIDDWPSIPVQLVLYPAALFVGCMVCHGELVRTRPHPRHLTAFYLSVSVGGALGGVFSSVVAPVVFDGLWELHLSLFAVAALLAGRRLAEPVRSRRWAVSVTAALGVLAIALALQVQTLGRRSVFVSRSFYGVLRVEELPDRYELFHGTIRHGRQFLGSRREVATTYYGKGSGVELALLQHPRRRAGRPLRVGAVGLGVGTIAAHGRAGDVFRFYEIDPDIAALAQGRGGYFRYLEDSPAKSEVVLGDARLVLERELAESGSQRFHVLVVDAFSSDAIPVHLLTTEAFALYAAHLAPGGVLAVHTSNRHLELVGVVGRQAEHLGLPAVSVYQKGEPPVTSSCQWVLITDNEAVLGHPRLAPDVFRPGVDPGIPVALWTDERANLYAILR